MLDAKDLREVRALLDVDPVADVFVASRVEAAGLDSWRLGAEVWGHGERGRLDALCYAGANLVPVQASATSQPLAAAVHQALSAPKVTG